MTTTAYPMIKTLVAGACEIFGSAVCSGIVGNTAHRKLRQGSYHLSRADNPPRTYSVIRPDDRAGEGPNDAASAFDISMNRADMILATHRLMGAWANPKDPRRKYLNAFNGWVGSGTAQRFDFVSHTIGVASPDHKWHVHVEIRRVYATSAAMVTAVLSILRGEPIAHYLLSIGVKPHAPAVATAVPHYPGRVLSRTASTKPDPPVALLQGRLLARGWKSIGKADGRFGPKLDDAVRRFQRQCKVPVDGQVGPRTWPLPWTRPLG